MHTRIGAQDILIGRFGEKVDVGCRKVLVQGAQHGCGQQDITQRTQAYHQDTGAFLDV